MPYGAGGATIIKEYIVFVSTSVVIKIQYEHANYGILESHIVLIF
jgi:hypothetical protein